MLSCKAIGCCATTLPGNDFCEPCQNKDTGGLSLSEQYPDQYKSVGDIAEIDVFVVHHLFQIQDPSGCLQHASRKLLLSGSGQPVYKDIKEARDTLTRWLQLNQGMNTP